LLFKITMKKIVFIILLKTIYSCSKIVVISSIDEYGYSITRENLNEFRNSSKINSKTIRGAQFSKEFRKIKGYLRNGNEDLIPSGIYFYAFINKSDTIYTDPNMTYWRYKGKTILYKSTIINNEQLMTFNSKM